MDFYCFGPASPYQNRQPLYDLEFMNPAVLRHPTQWMPIGWLETKQNWPENAERMLKEFMVEHNFYHYYKTKDKSKNLLEAIVNKLGELFDPSEWDPDTHKKKLKDKVINKIHRIRHQLAARGAVDDLRTALGKVVPEDHDEILQAVFDVVGLAKAKAFLTAREQQ